MIEIKYKNLTAQYEENTAKDLKDAHDVDLEYEILQIMKFYSETSEPLTDSR